MDESAADDGALYAFWGFVDVVRQRRDRPFDPDRLDDVAQFLAAVAAFDDEVGP